MTTSLTLMAALVLGAPALKDKEPVAKGPGYLGVRFSKEGEGLIVTDVQPDSPALKAGVRPNDVIMKVDSMSLKDADTGELVKVVGAMRPGTVVALEIKRGTESLTIKVKLGARPADFQALSPDYPLVPPLPNND
ncbi:PDZ domain-containing protein [Zavarzinella formosa]|uniref:PDZ domain-containing protein n=1 Tax=Zavarzinella formosa TaxID=360055 RepID=UPI0012F75B3D|nr:PDZ domain-containing protein [Zavarzinella formosa]